MGCWLCLQGQRQDRAFGPGTGQDRIRCLHGSPTDRRLGVNMGYSRSGLEPGIGRLVGSHLRPAAGGKDFSVAAVHAVTETSLEEGAGDDRCLLLLCAQEEWKGTEGVAFVFCLKRVIVLKNKKKEQKVWPHQQLRRIF